MKNAGVLVGPAALILCAGSMASAQTVPIPWDLCGQQDVTGLGPPTPLPGPFPTAVSAANFDCTVPSNVPLGAGFNLLFVRMGGTTPAFPMTTGEVNDGNLGINISAIVDPNPDPTFGSRS